MAEDDVCIRMRLEMLDGPLDGPPVGIAVIGVEPPDDLAGTRRKRPVESIRLAAVGLGRPVHPRPRLAEQIGAPVRRPAVPYDVLDARIGLRRDASQTVGEVPRLV